MMCLGSIVFYDFKERKVYWFLFPIALLLFGSLHFLSTIEPKVFFYYAFINFLLVTSIITILFVYSYFISKKAFLNHSLGLGDILFFYAFGFGFSTTTFIVLFVGTIIFSLLIFLLFKKSFKLDTVPLAGLMGLFLVFVILFSLISKSPPLYAY